MQSNLLAVVTMLGPFDKNFFDFKLTYPQHSWEDNFGLWVFSSLCWLLSHRLAHNSDVNSQVESFIDSRVKAIFIPVGCYPSSDNVNDRNDFIRLTHNVLLMLTQYSQHSMHAIT